MPSAADKDVHFMRRALAEAGRAAKRGEVPVGALVVAEGRVLAQGHNSSIAACDPTAHAEIVALRKAARKLANYRLPDCELFVTLEPCAMCLGAIVQARFKRLVYGARDAKAGAVRSVMKFPFGNLNHRPDVVGGVLAEECGALLKDFFRAKRRARKT